MEQNVLPPFLNWVTPFVPMEAWNKHPRLKIRVFPTRQVGEHPRSNRIGRSDSSEYNTENFSVSHYDQFGQKGYVFWRVSQKG